ncbi:MAG: class I SAM-dependent methyltransferase [Candidatus Roizmanbacteria bacterium]|nr:class I SAM-dependent methyltransferase [Candidatus Roizmanbacteria bacterium]
MHEQSSSGLHDWISSLITRVDALRGDQFRSHEGLRARQYLRRFNLDWSQLKGKQILDIGAGQAGFAKRAQQKGISVVSFDKAYGYMGLEDFKPFKGIPYIIGDAQALHTYFYPEQFDLALSKSSLKYMLEFPKDRQPIVVSIEEQFNHIVHEVEQVLKSGGEFRFDGEDWLYNLYALHNSSQAQEVTIQQQATHGLEWAQNINPHITLHWGKGKTETEKKPFFIFSKPIQ